MKLNPKPLRQLRRALRTQATELVKFRKEIIDSDLKDHWRWKSWVQHGPATIHQLLQAAEVLDDVLRCGGRFDGVSNTTLARHSRKRRKRLRLVKPVRPSTDQVHASPGAVQ
jgi:hypothetical protein